MFPSLLAVNGKKKIYQPLRAAFDEDSISKFLSDMVLGKGRNIKYDFHPSLDKVDAREEL